MVALPNFYQPTYLPTILLTYLLPTYHNIPMGLKIWRSWGGCPTYLPTFLPSTNLPTYLPSYLPTSYLPTNLPTYHPTYLPTNQSTYLPESREQCAHKPINSLRGPAARRSLYLLDSRRGTWIPRRKSANAEPEGVHLNILCLVVRARVLEIPVCPTEATQKSKTRKLKSGILLGKRLGKCITGKGFSVPQKLSDFFKKI